MCATSKPLELRFHAFLVVLLTTRKCHNWLENHGRHEYHTFFIFTSTKAFWSSCLEREHHWSSHGAVAVTTASTKLHPQGFNNSQSNALHMTLLHPLHPPTPPSVNNNDTCNVTTSSTKQHPQGFNKSQSNAVHMTLLHLPHPPTPHLYTITTFIVHDKIEDPWKLRGTPSLDPIYIYIYIYIHIYIYIYIYTLFC